MNTYKFIENDFLSRLSNLAEEYKQETLLNDVVRESYCQKIAEAYKKIDGSSNGLNFGLSKKVFLFDEDMSNALNVVENKILANEIKEFLKDYSGVEMVNIKVSLAHTMIEDNKFCKWDDNVYGIWKEVMRDVPGFNEALLKEKKYWDNWREQNFKIDSSEATQNFNEETVMTLLVYMPILVKLEKDNGIQVKLNEIDNSSDILFKDLIEDFNNFKLHKYMREFAINDISLSIDNQNWVFRAKFNQPLNDTEKSEFLENLKSQISEGWGESMGGKKIKTNDSCFFVSFDHENAQISEEIKKKNKMK